MSLRGRKNHGTQNPRAYCDVKVHDLRKLNEKSQPPPNTIVTNKKVKRDQKEEKESKPRQPQPPLPTIAKRRRQESRKQFIDFVNKSES